MKIFCEECGHRGEMDGDHFSVKLQCPKCGLQGLNRESSTNYYSGGEITTLDTKAAVKEAERIVGNNREKVKELVRQGKSQKEIKEILKGSLSVTSVRSYYCYAKKELGMVPSRAGAPMGNKNRARPKQGEVRYCLDCGKKLYIVPYRLKHPKSENSGRRCQPCALKSMMKIRKNIKRRGLTIKAMKAKITEIHNLFLDGIEGEFKNGAILACSLILGFIDKDLTDVKKSVKMEQ